MDKKVEIIPVFTQDVISRQVAETARQISADYRGCDLVLIAVLKGAFVFLADLSRQLSFPAVIDFIWLSSYRDSVISSEVVELKQNIETNIKGKDVLIIEDIVDTGLTLEYLLEHLKQMDPKSIGVCALLDKPCRRRTQVHINYACFIADDDFFVGYGLDYAEQYRHLPHICRLKFLMGEDLT